MENNYDNLHAYTTVKTWDEKYELSCLIDKKGNINNDLCILILPDIGRNNVWDNPDFIWKELYDTVKSYIVNKQVTIDFEDIMQDIPVEDFKQVYELLEFGIKLGFRKDGE